MSKYEEAVQFVSLVSDAESTNRAKGMEELRFGYGDQWPAYAVNARRGQMGGPDRPMLVINETDAYLRQVCNQQRQQRPRINVHAVGNGADAKKAKVIRGMIRHFEVNSNADHAYDTAFEYAVRMGWGYFRMFADYIAPDSFDQDIFFGSIDNPFSVYFDPHSVMPDGSDAKKCLITDMVAKDTFRAEYPDANDGAGIRSWIEYARGFLQRASGDTSPEWLTKDSIRTAEYYYIEQVKDVLYKLSNGGAAYESELKEPKFRDVLLKNRVSVLSDKKRDSIRNAVKWEKVTAFETLAKRDIPGRYIPVIPVYGTVTILDGKRHRSGLIRLARDPQILLNFETSAFAESVALAPKAKWLMAEGQDEGHENEWTQANTSPLPYLRYNPAVLQKDGTPAPPPQRLQPEAPPEGIMAAMANASSGLQKVLGMFDPEIQARTNKSGKAINAEQQQSDQSNFHYYDNLTRSLEHAGRIALSWIPTYFDLQRAQRIIGDDGRPSMVTINQPGQNPVMDAQGQPMVDEDGKAIMEVLNDVRIGTYDVVMDTGPGYNSKRQQAVEMMTMLFAKDPELMKVAGDLYFRMQDWDGADTIADRLAAMNPMAQTDPNSDIPEQAQIMIKGLQAKVQQLSQMLQAAGQEIKMKTGIEQMKQAGETQREHLRMATKAHDIETNDATKRHDVEMRALSGLGEAELDGLVKILVEHLKTSRDREAGERDAEAFERQAGHEMQMAETKANEAEPRAQ